MKDNTFVVADFDKTLTKPIIKGKHFSGVISVLRDGGYIHPEYVKKSKALKAHYYPIETSDSYSLDEKNHYMKEWWQKHLELFVRYGLTKKVIQEAATDGQIQLREDARTFFDELKAKNIPLLIFSAGVSDIIEAYLKDQNLLSDNVHIYANTFTYTNNKVSGYERAIIHSLNKHNHDLSNIDFSTFVKKRNHLVLLGDSPSDIGMKTHFTYDTIHSFAFTNGRDIKLYKDFDTLIQTDSMKPVLDYLQTLFSR